jgi:hypothetical protein
LNRNLNRNLNRIFQHNLDRLRINRTVRPLSREIYKIFNKRRLNKFELIIFGLDKDKLWTKLVYEYCILNI